MSKWIEVTVTASRVCLVQVEDTESEDDAIEQAVKVAFSGGYDEAVTGKTITEPSEIERCARHADEVIHL